MRALNFRERLSPDEMLRIPSRTKNVIRTKCVTLSKLFNSVFILDSCVILPTTPHIRGQITEMRILTMGNSLTFNDETLLVTTNKPPISYSRPCVNQVYKGEEKWLHCTLQYYHIQS